jgi:hypothetical protein
MEGNGATPERCNTTATIATDTVVRDLHTSKGLLDLPQEILNEIYRQHFQGIILVPWTAEFSRDDLDYSDSRLALLLLCKSQKEAIYQILIDSATIKFRCECDVATFATGKASVDRIQGLQIRERVVNAAWTPFLLMSKALRRLPNLTSLQINMDEIDKDDEVFGVEDYWYGFEFQHTTLLEEMRSPCRNLRNAAGRAMASCQWLHDLIVQPDGLKITIDFRLRSGTNVKLGRLVPGELEVFDVPVELSFDT